MTPILFLDDTALNDWFRGEVETASRIVSRGMEKEEISSEWV